MKLLVVLVAVALLLWLLRSGQERRQARPPAKGAPRPPRTAQPEDMVRCDACGLHLPRSDALATPHGIFCCAEHQRAGRTPRP